MAERPGVLWGITLLLSLVSLLGLFDPTSGELRLRIDPSTSGLVASGDEAQHFYEQTRRRFGDDEALVLALHFDELFSFESLGRIATITQQLEALPEAPEVLSLSNAVHIRAADGDIEIGPFFDTPPEDAAGLARLRAALAGNPLYADSLLGPDGRTTVIRIAFPNLSQSEFQERRISERVREIGEREAGDARVYLSGSLYVKATLSSAILENIGGVLPLIFGAVALVLLLAFRSMAGLLLPLSAIALALLWTLGAIAWTGRPLNLVTSIVPPLVITLGFAYAMHLVSEYYDVCERAADEFTRTRLIREVVEEVALAILVAGGTTAIGFISLALSPLPAIREFGLFSALGVAFSVLATLNFGTAALYLVTPRKGSRESPRPGIFDRLTNSLSRFDLDHRRWVLAAGWCVLLLALVGASRIRVGAEHIGNFSEESLVRRDYEAINGAMGGANPLTIVAETELPEGLTELAHMRAVKELQGWLEAQPEIGSTSSYVDYLMLLHRAFFDDDPAEFRLPDSQRAAKQLLLFGSAKEAERMLDARFQSAAISVRTRVNDSYSVARLLERIEARLSTLPNALSATLTGDIVVLNRTLDDIARSQLRSIAFAILTIYAVLALLFTSLRVGLIALFPNIL
ncbi:MAG: MMPL family transporter, partial [Myxococcota bacterium]